MVKKKEQLLNAVRKGGLESVKKLIRPILFFIKGADVNAKTSDDYTPSYMAGYTPLHMASQYGHKEIAESLIAEGANVNVKTKNGTPLI